MLRAISFNVRYDEPADGLQAWQHRCALVIATIRDHAPDLIGLQEPAAAQFDEIAAALPEYSAFGLYRDEWGGVEPHGGFVRTDRFDIRTDGVFWISETPSIPYSISWGNDWGPRACGWARLRDRQHDRELVFASTHVDTNADSWLPSAKVLHAELDRLAGDAPVVLVGDFNCPADSGAHRYLLSDAGFRDAWYDAGRNDEETVTYHGFTGATHLADATHLYPDTARAHRNYRIDWILIRGEITCTAAEIDHRGDEGLMPSDHYPVLAAIEYSASARRS